MPPPKNKSSLLKKAHKLKSSLLTNNFASLSLHKSKCKGETYIQIDNEVYYVLFEQIVDLINNVKKLLKNTKFKFPNKDKQSSSKKSSSKVELSYKKESDLKFMEEIQDDLILIKECKTKAELNTVCAKLYLKYHPDKEDGNSNYFRIVREKCKSKKTKLS